jgi:hypothetical protein
MIEMSGEGAYRSLLPHYSSSDPQLLESHTITKSEARRGVKAAQQGMSYLEIGRKLQ